MEGKPEDKRRRSQSVLAAWSVRWQTSSAICIPQLGHGRRDLISVMKSVFDNDAAGLFFFMSRGPPPRKT